MKAPYKQQWRGTLQVAATSERTRGFLHDRRLGLPMSQNMFYTAVEYKLSAPFNFRMSTFRQDDVAQMGPS